MWSGKEPLQPGPPRASPTGRAAVSRNEKLSRVGKSLTPPPQAAQAGTRHTALQLRRPPDLLWVLGGAEPPLPSPLHPHRQSAGDRATTGGGVLAVPEGCLDLGGRQPLDKDTTPLGQGLLEHFGQPVPLSPETSN